LSLPIKRWYARLVNRHALGALAIGGVARLDFLRWGIRRDRIAELAYCVAPSTGGGTLTAAERFRLGRFVVGFVGELCWRKGVDLLLRALARPGLADAGVGLLIVGDGRERDRLGALARGLGLEGSVHFRGAVPWKLVQSEMRACDAFALPSRFDGWGVVLNEAATVGLPLIASEAVGGAHDLIIPGWNGLRFASGAVEDLALALRTYSRSPALATAHGSRSREIAKEFTPERQAEKFCSALDAWRAGANRDPRV
jgi:glycosyltransferase involved in cell wall biosynthesis